MWCAQCTTGLEPITMAYTKLPMATQPFFISFTFN